MSQVLGQKPCSICGVVGAHTCKPLIRSTIPTPKHLSQEMIRDLLTYGMSVQRISPKDMFCWYTGHDPYNSADDQAFMERLQ